MKNLLVAFVLFSAASFSQSNRGLVGVPTLGILFDEQVRGFRAIGGIPGSAMLGSKIEIGRDLLLAATSARSGLAIGVDASGVAVLIGESEIAGLMQARKNASAIIFSADGLTAALYFSDDKVVQIFGNLSNESQLLREVKLEATPVAMAIDDGGATLLASNSRGLYAYKADGGIGILLPSETVRAFDFAGNGTDIVAADQQSVWLIRDGLARLVVSVKDAISVAGSTDGKRIFALLATGRAASVSVDSGEVVWVDCNCSPIGFSRLRGAAVFRLNSPKDGTVWLLDGDGESLRIAFVASQGDNK